MASLIVRGFTFYIQYMVSGKAKRMFTGTESLQIAKEKLRQFESAQARGEDLPLPTRTPIDAVLSAYVSHIRNVKTPKSAQTDIYYLRDAFGPISEALKITSRKVSAKTKKRPPKLGQDRRRKATVIEANCFEQITTADIARFISGHRCVIGFVNGFTNVVQCHCLLLGDAELLKQHREVLRDSTSLETPSTSTGRISSTLIKSVPNGVSPSSKLA